MNVLRLTFLATALAVLPRGAAGAEPPPRPASSPETDARKVLRPGEVEIRGKVRKPTPPSITPPSVSIRQEAERRKSFLPKIVEAHDEEPFRATGK